MRLILTVRSSLDETDSDRCNYPQSLIEHAAFVNTTRGRHDSERCTGGASTWNSPRDKATPQSLAGATCHCRVTEYGQRPAWPPPSGVHQRRSEGVLEGGRAQIICGRWQESLRIG